MACGGMKSLLRAMRTVPGDPELQVQGLGILASPLIASERVVRVEPQAFIRAVLGSMRRYVAHCRLQSLGCLALANLAQKKEGHIKILVEQGALSLILKCLHS